MKQAGLQVLAKGTHSICQTMGFWGVAAATSPHLTQRPVELPKDALLVKHLPLVPVFIVIVDFLAEISRQLVEGHVLFHLLVLKGGEPVSVCSRERPSPVPQLGDPGR